MNERQHDAHVKWRGTQARVRQLERDLESARIAMAAAHQELLSAIRADKTSWRGSNAADIR